MKLLIEDGYGDELAIPSGKIVTVSKFKEAGIWYVRVVLVAEGVKIEKDLEYGSSQEAKAQAEFGRLNQYVH